MIEEADRDGDGEISEDEFMRIMRKTNLFWAVDREMAPFYGQKIWDLKRKRTNK